MKYLIFADSPEEKQKMVEESIKERYKKKTYFFDKDKKVILELSAIMLIGTLVKCINSPEWLAFTGDPVDLDQNLSQYLQSL